MTEHPEKILIVDDNRMNIAAARASLKELNGQYTLIEAENGEEAIKVARRANPALILLDIRLPDMEGFQVAKTLKASRATKHIPIIYISGLDDVDSKLEGFMTGGVDYITKPFHRQEVLARVTTQLKIHRLQNNLATRNQEIHESITYAKKIQEAILPTKDQMKKAFPGHFIFYRPKDVLSGDLFWLKKYHGDWLLACMDCTGHGIPGALISIVGHNLLDQVTGIESDLNPAEILKRIDKKFIETLRQESTVRNTQDGIDMALCRINLKKKKLQFSGAYRPIFQVRKKSVIEWKGSKYPVGGTQIRKKTYTNHEVKLLAGDDIYLFSDGFADQFGGKDGKKLTGKRFRDLLRELSGKTPAEQRKGLKKAFDEWKGDLEQLDDVLVIGLKC